jgi:polysaccharide export outer membrane protein
LRFLRTAAIVALGLAAGCEVKSFINPGEVGRWDKDPLPVPILDTLDVGIEETDSQFLDAKDPAPEDLVASAEDYVIGRSDLLTISITDLVAPGIESVRQTRVSESGRISLPIIGQVDAVGKTEAQLEAEIAEEYRDAQVIQNAQVTVVITELQSRTFSVRGGVSQPGRYAIVNSDFRLLDALVMARDVNDPLQEYIYVVRRTDLSEPQKAGEKAPGGEDTGEDILAPQSKSGQGANWVALLQAGGEPAPAETPAAEPAAETTPAAETPAAEPAAETTPAAETPAEPAPGEGRYIIIDGKPVLMEGGEVTEPPAAETTETPETPAATTPETGETGFEFKDPGYLGQNRVIRIPYQALNNGDLKYNIVIRPYDMIVVPNPVIGEYYVGGHVGRVGVYSLTGRKITLKQAIISAGMLDGIAIPQRTEVIRRIGDDKEIFVRVNLDKIFDGQQPDLYLKPNDIVNVGTNFFAPFIASARNAFRMTYGFGFLYDRNFADQDDDDDFF